MKNCIKTYTTLDQCGYIEAAKRQDTHKYILKISATFRSHLMTGHKDGDGIFTQNVIKIPLFYFSLNLIQIDTKKKPVGITQQKIAVTCISLAARISY